MAKTTISQRVKRAGLPYTAIRCIASPRVLPQFDGSSTVNWLYEYHVFGYVLEEKLQPHRDQDDPVWKPEWEESLICQEATLGEAFGVAAEWRASLVGDYPIR